MPDAVVDVLDVVTLTEPSEYKLDVSHCKPLANSGRVTFENVPVILLALIRSKLSLRANTLFALLVTFKLPPRVAFPFTTNLLLLALLMFIASVPPEDCTKLPIILV